MTPSEFNHLLSSPNSLSPEQMRQLRHELDNRPAPSVMENRQAEAGEQQIRRLLAELHHSRAARIRVAGGGAGGDAPDAQASALGPPYG